MTKKVYRTAQGRLVDLGALEVQNEHIRAVGNMNVNARGDKLDADGNVISKAPKNEMPNTTNKTKNAKLNQTLVAKLFIASAPKINVTPKPNKI